MGATLRGETIKISFGSLSYTGYVPEDVTISHPDGNTEVIRDADGATMTRIYMDPSDKFDGTFVIESDGEIDPPSDGDTVGLTTPDGTSTTFISEGSSTAHAPGATKLSLSLTKEESMDYS